MFRKKKRIYMDFAAATPLHPQVVQEMVSALGYYGNPSASHTEGRHAKELLESARTRIARVLGTKASDLYITGSGTESNNLALLGFIQALIGRGAQASALHVIVSAFEHSSAHDAADALEALGVQVTRVYPNEDGIITPEVVQQAVTPQTVLVSIIAVQSEIGVIQPLKDIARMLELVREKRLQTTQSLIPEMALPVLHTDASQSLLFLDLAPERLGVHMATYDAQKCMGPKGVGLLYRDPNIPLQSLLYGGKQERGVRPGTENIAGAVGMAVAFEYAKQHREHNVQHATTLRDYFFTILENELPDVEVNGSIKKRIANNVHISLPHVDADYLTILMDAEGIAVSPRSACMITPKTPSKTVLALGKSETLAQGTLRFTFGPDTTKSDIRRTVDALKRSLAVIQGNQED